MSYYDKGYKPRISLGQNGNALTALIVINLTVFIVFAFVKLIFRLRYDDAGQAMDAFDQNVLSWVSLPADAGKLLHRPWTIITHMFMHDGVWHIFGNMLWLWMFGYILQDLTGNSKIIPVFLYSAFGGAIVFLLAYNLAPGFQSQVANTSALGASAGIMGIVVVTTIVSPGYRIFPMIAGGIPLWVLTTIYLIIDLATFPYSNPGGHLGHLGGALTGALYMFFLRRGYDWGEWMNNFFDWFGNLFDPDKPKKGKKIKEELFYKSTVKPFEKTPNVTQQRVDDILDKINQKGYHFLTEEEKELLKRASKDI